MDKFDSELVGRELAFDDFQWAERCEYWRTHRDRRTGRPRKYRYREPLFLTGHGISIRIDRNTLLIRNGFTHYPQKLEETRFLPGDPNLPDRIIISGKGGAISLDAINWMSEQEITLVQLDWRGRTISVGANSGYSTNPQLVEGQRRAQTEPLRAKIGRWLISEKIQASIATLRGALPKSKIREMAISRLKDYLDRLANSENSITVQKILGVEGAAARAYFDAWRGIPLKWSGLSRRPIPDTWHIIGPRQMTWRETGRNARHPVNAILNYGYGILVSEIRKHVSAAGMDPSIGLLHRSADNRVPLIYDLMEPLRPVVDRGVLIFALSQTFTPGDFTINRYGGCRLNPQMARAVVGANDIKPKHIVDGFRRMLAA